MERNREFYFQIAQRVYSDLSRESFVVNLNDRNFAFASLSGYEILHYEKRVEDNFTFGFSVKATYSKCQKQTKVKWVSVPGSHAFVFPLIRVVERFKVTQRPSVIYDAILSRYKADVILLQEYHNPDISTDHFTEFMKANRIAVIFLSELEPVTSNYKKQPF